MRHRDRYGWLGILSQWFLDVSGRFCVTIIAYMLCFGTGFRSSVFVRVHQILNALTVTVVGNIGECAQVWTWSKVLREKFLSYLSIVCDLELTSLFR